jgi:hypothetical protein
MRSKVIVPAMGAVALSLVGCGSSGTGKTNRSGVQLRLNRSSQQCVVGWTVGGADDGRRRRDHRVPR